MTFEKSFSFETLIFDSDRNQIPCSLFPRDSISFDYLNKIIINEESSDDIPYFDKIRIRSELYQEDIIVHKFEECEKISNKLVVTLPHIHFETIISSDLKVYIDGLSRKISIYGNYLFIDKKSKSLNYGNPKMTKYYRKYIFKNTSGNISRATIGNVLDAFEICSINIEKNNIFASDIKKLSVSLDGDINELLLYKENYTNFRHTFSTNDKELGLYVNGSNFEFIVDSLENYTIEFTGYSILFEYGYKYIDMSYNQTLDPKNYFSLLVYNNEASYYKLYQNDTFSDKEYENPSEIHVFMEDRNIVNIPVDLFSKSFEMMTKLYLSHNNIVNISLALQQFHNLEFVDLSYNNIQTLNTIYFKKIKYIDISHNPLSVITPFNYRKKNISLNLIETPVFYKYYIFDKKLDTYIENPLPNSNIDKNESKVKEDDIIAVEPSDSNNEEDLNQSLIQDQNQDIFSKFITSLFG